MHIDAAFPSKFLRASDLAGKTPRVTIEHVEMATMQDGTRKPVLIFEGKSKGLVLNKTNANKIKSAYGAETDRWTGKDLILFGTLVEFGGEEVEAIRVRIPAQQAVTPAKAPPPSRPSDYGAHEDPEYQPSEAPDEEAF